MQITWYLGNMIWPATYIYEDFFDFWYLVIGTIVIELFILKLFLKFSWQKSALASVFGNLVSAFFGTFFMKWAMLAWHLVVDQILNGTFNLVNWIATLVIMCFGSVFWEVIAVQIAFKEKLKRLFLPMMIGNILSYLFIVYSFLYPNTKHPDEEYAIRVYYVADQTSLTLRDGSNRVDLDTAYLRIIYNEEGEVINEKESLGYKFVIQYQLMQTDSFGFHFRMIDDEWWGGTYPRGKSFEVDDLLDEYKVVYEEFSTDSEWSESNEMYTPIDTITFREVLRKRETDD